MLKKELIEATASESEYPQHVVRTVLDAANKVIIGALAASRTVNLFGLGKIGTRTKNPRIAMNFGHEPILVPAHTIIRFTPSINLSSAVRDTAPSDR